MTKIELKKILDNYDDNIELIIAVSDRYQTISFSNINIDSEVSKDDALVLCINIDEKEELYIAEG